jgi:hypothetical protein
MAEAEAELLAAAKGIACHLTSLVLVDEAGGTQNCLPSTRKVPLSAPGMAPMPAAAPAYDDMEECHPLPPQPCCTFDFWRCPGVHVDYNPQRGSIASERLEPAGSPRAVRRKLRRWSDRIDWETDPDDLRRGDLSGLGDKLVREIELAARADEASELAAELGVPGQVIVLALLGTALPKNRVGGRERQGHGLALHFARQAPRAGRVGQQAAASRY